MTIVSIECLPEFLAWYSQQYRIRTFAQINASAMRRGLKLLFMAQNDVHSSFTYNGISWVHDNEYSITSEQVKIIWSGAACKSANATLIVANSGITEQIKVFQRRKCCSPSIGMVSSGAHCTLLVFCYHYFTIFAYVRCENSKTWALSNRSKFVKNVNMSIEPISIK